MAEMRWRRRIGDVLAEAVATRLSGSCGVSAGDVAFYLLPSGGDGVGGGDVSGGGPVDVVLASLHIVDTTAESPETKVCVSALANPAIAGDLTSLVGKHLTERAAGEEPGEGWEAWGLSSPPAEGFKVVETGKVTVRTAFSGNRLIDNHAVEVVAGGNEGEVGNSGRSNSQQQRVQKEKPPLDVGTSEGAADAGSLEGSNPAGGGGGSGSGSQQGLPGIDPWPDSGLSPDMVFAFQAIGVIALLFLLLLAQRCRSTSRGGGLGAPWRRRRGGGGGGSGSPSAAGDAGGDAVRYRRKTGAGQTGKGEHSA